MKTKTNIFKTAFIAFALFCSAQTFAQVYPTAPTAMITDPAGLNVGTINNNDISTFSPINTNTVLFYKPNTAGTGSETGMILQANSADSEGNTFVTYQWYKLQYDGTNEVEGTQLSETGSQLTVSALPAGYHKYRVYGEIGTATVCPSDEYQDMIVFVLPQLNVAPTLAGTMLTYCENAVPAAGTNTLAATIEADYSLNLQSYPKPGDTDAAAAFDLTYKWYALPSGGGTAVSLGTDATVDISATTLPPGTYTFYVEVEYANTIRDNATQGRTYVTYGTSNTTSGTTGTVIVTATPGTPTITVDSVTD